MSGTATLLISDIHTRYQVINQQIEHAEESTGCTVGQVIVLGDFGFFGDEMHEYFRRAKNRFLRPVFCIEGNHEDYRALQDLTGRYADVVTHLRRGVIHIFGPWRGLCLGGARYMDAASTPPGCEISDGDVDACLAHAPDAVDVVLSHDCPTGIGVPNTPGMEHYGAPGAARMDRLVEHFHPRRWFFGHHHRWHDVSVDGTRYLGLPQCWFGYVLVHDQGDMHIVHNEVSIAAQPWWRRWL